MAAMKTLEKNTTSTLRELGSKFYGFLVPVRTVEHFELILSQLKKDYLDASHHCYAYRVHPEQVIEFSSDDGEPSGTAGLPILNQLKSAELVNVGGIVVRYFGGTKLGKPGLIKAYGASISECIQSANLSTIELVTLFRITYPYELESIVNKWVLTFELTEQESKYTAEVQKTFACTSTLKEDCEAYLESISYHPLTYEELGDTFVMI